VHYTTLGGSPTHPAFNWATPIMRNRIICLADRYWEATGAVLSFNDMSLPLGGLFDFRGNWGADHQFHRLGRSVDVNSMAQGPDGLPKPVRLGKLIPIATECDLDKVREATIHFDLSAAVDLP
jgi:hypothetical protein